MSPTPFLSLLRKSIVKHCMPVCVPVPADHLGTVNKGCHGVRLGCRGCGQMTFVVAFRESLFNTLDVRLDFPHS